MKNSLCLLFSVLFVFICNTTNAQLIYTFAGNGTAGYSGNGGSPTGAELNAPTSLAIDGSGNIYIADQGNNVIRKVSVSGIISTVAGNDTAGFSGDTGNATMAMLYTPAGIAADISGNLYIADMKNSRIRKVNTSGTIYTIGGNGTAGYSGDGGAATAAELGSPVGIAVDDTGNIYIADSSDNVIRKVDTFGNISTIAGTGIAGYTGDNAAATTAQLYHPTGIAIDATHNIFIADNGNNVIRKINTSGVITTFAGNGTAGYSGDSSPATNAQLSAPYGIALDGSGNAYIADQNNNRFREVNTSGTISTISGTGTAGYTGDGGSAYTATLNAPAGLVIDGNGNKYIADYANNVIRVISSDNAPSFVNGPSQTMTTCENSNENIDTLLEISDADYGQTETWTIISGPEHGIVSGIPYYATSDGGTITPAGITYTPNAGYSGTDILTFQISDGIATAVTTIDVTINPLPNVATLTNQSLCNGAMTSAIDFSDTVSGAAFTWTSSNTSIGLSNGTGNIAPFTAINTSSVVVTDTVTVIPTANGCTGIPQNFMITVNPTPDVVMPSDQVLCNGTTASAINFSGSVSGATYTWTNSDTSIGLAPSDTGNIAPFIVRDTSGTAHIATITVMPSANGCTGASKNFTITVNPAPNVTTPASQVLCSGTASTAVNFTGNVSGATYNWTNNNSSIGLASSGTGNIAAFTTTDTSGTVQTATITVTPSANGCTDTSTSFTITVNPTPNMLTLADYALCNGTTTPAINFSGSVSGTTYTWTNSDTSIGLASGDTGNIAPFIVTDTSGAVYTATITVSASANGCSDTAQNFTITVYPTPNVTTPASQVLCSGTASTAVNFTGNVSGATYNWTNNNNSIGVASSGTGNIAAFTTTDTSGTVQTATITVTPSANGCTGTSTSFTITVNPTPNMLTLTDYALCNGTTTPAINFSGSVSGTTFTWTNSDTSIGLASGDTGNIAPFIVTDTSGAVYTATITVSASANGCSDTAQNFTITVYPTPNVTTPASQVLCSGTASTAVNFTGNVSGATYNWANNNNSIGLASSGTGNIAAFTTTDTSGTVQTATITVTPSANGCTDTSTSFTITVNPTPNMLTLTDYALCNGTTTPAINFSGSVSGTTYTWTNSDTSIGLASGDTGNIAPFIVTDTSGAVYTATITVTASASGCSDTAQNFTITVYPTPNVTTPASQVLCSGTASTAVNFTGNVSGATYNWTNNNSSIGLASSGTGNIAAFTTTDTSGTVQTATITVTPSANGCTDTSTSFTITVNPTPNMLTLADYALCNGTTTPAINFSGSVSGTTYTWTNSDTSIGLASGDTGNIAPFIVTDTSGAVYTATITVSASANGCSDTAQNFTITVYPTPEMDTPANQSACNGSMVAPINFNSLVSGYTTYTWTNSDTSIGLAGSDTGNIASFTAIDTTSSPVIATINVTPASNGCTGTHVSFMITVNPNPRLSSPLVMSPICDSTMFIYMPTSITSGITFTWSRDTVAGISNSAANGIDSINEILVNTTPDTVTVTYTDTLTANGCSSIQDVTVIVNPKPMLSSMIMPTAICSNNMFSYTPASATIGATFTWSRDTVAGISNPTASGTGSINETLLNTTPNPIVVTYIYTLTANGCINTENIMVTVNPIPMLSSTLTPLSICDSTMFSYIPASATAGVTFSWSRDTTEGISNPYSSDTGNINEILIDTTVNPVAVTYVDTIMANGCMNTQDVFVTVNPRPMLTNTLTATMICNNTLFTYTSTSGTTGTTYAWSRDTVTGISNGSASDTGNISEVLINTGNFQIAVTYVDTLMANGCINTENITVTVNPTPALNSTLTPASICNNTLFSYAPSSGVSGVTFSWAGPYADGINLNASSGTGNINEVLDDTTNTNVNVTYIYTTTAYGCNDTQDVVVTVYSTPTLSSATTDSVCSGSVFNYTPTSSDSGATYSWARAQISGITPDSASGTGNISETLTNSQSTPVAVIYIYTVTVNSCSDTQSISVLVNTSTPAPAILTTTPSTVCSNTLLQNFGAATPPPAGINYVWSASNASISTVGSTAQYALVNFETAGTAVVMLTAMSPDFGCQSQAMDTINVTSSVADSPADVIYFGAEFVCLQNNETGYQWGYDNDSTLAPTILTGQINQNYYNDTPNFSQYNYWVIVSDNGCEQKAYYNLPNGAAYRLASTQVNIYPNPAAENINIQIITTETGIVQVEILDLTGQIITTAPSVNNTAEISVANLPAGCYLVNCYRNGVKISSAKFVKN